MKRKLTRSQNDRAIQGVCGGIAEYFGISSFGVRLIFILLPLPTNLILYIILANSMSDTQNELDY